MGVLSWSVLRILAVGEHGAKLACVFQPPGVTALGERRVGVVEHLQRLVPAAPGTVLHAAQAPYPIAALITDRGHPSIELDDWGRWRRANGRPLSLPYVCAPKGSRGVPEP